MNSQQLSWRQQRHLTQGPNLESWALLSGAGAILLIAISGIGGPRNWWTRQLELTLNSPTASGLSRGMDVKIAGYPVGRVQRIQLLNNGQVVVKLSVEAERAHLVGPRSQATLGQDSLLSRPYIALSQDRRPERAQRGAIATGFTIPYSPVAGIPTLINELASSRLSLQQGIDGAVDLVKRRLPLSLDQVDRTLKSGERLSGTLEQELSHNGGSIGSSLQATTTNLNQTLTQLQSTMREVQALAESSNKLLGQLNRSWLLKLLKPADDPQLRNKRE